MVGSSCFNDQLNNGGKKWFWNDFEMVWNGFEMDFVMDFEMDFEMDVEKDV